MAEPSVVGSMLDREFLDIRSRLLDVAAALDRVDRANDSSASDARRQQICDVLALLASDEPDRAERTQLLFSLAYDTKWRERFGL